MHPAGRNNPCGTKEPDRDASDRGKVIPVEQKSPIGMHPLGRNHPCYEVTIVKRRFQEISVSVQATFVFLWQRLERALI